MPNVRKMAAGYGGGSHDESNRIPALSMCIRLAHIINTKLRKKYILCHLGEIERSKTLQVTIKSRKIFIREASLQQRQKRMGHFKKRQ